LPYIARNRRAKLDPPLSALRDALARIDGAEGDVNYCVTSIVAFGLPEDATYAEYNAAIGVLESAKLEMYRRQVGPYEDTARVRNGPVAWIRTRAGRA
jgi:hypothetical protein